MNHLPLVAIATLAGLAGHASAQSLVTGPDSPPRLAMLDREPDPAAQPGGAGKPSGPAVGAADGGGGVKAAFTPYAWLPSFNGDATVRGITVDVDLSFSDILDKSSSIVALMGAIDLEYDRFVFNVNGAFTSVDADASRGIFGNTTVSADATLDMGWYEVFGGYRFLDKPLEGDGARRLTLDGLIGGRLTTIDIDTTISSETTVTLPGGEVITTGQSAERSNSKDWFEPFVGARLGLDLSEHWVASVRADVGGFGLDGAELAWQTVAVIGYRWKMDGWTLTALGGYRALSQDYSDGDFGWDVVSHGPLLAASFGFAF